MQPNSRRSLLIDENTTRTLAPALRTLGHQAQHVCEAGLQGYPDPDVFAFAQSHKQILVTFDLDFSNIMHYTPPHAGIIVLRIPNSASTEEVIQIFLNALSKLEGQDLSNCIVIVEPKKIRLRKL